MRIPTATLALCVLLSACQSGTSLRPAGAYPAPISGFERFDEFPAKVASYARVQVTAYSPDLKDYSVGYNRNDQLVQGSVTVYVYPCDENVQRQLEAEQSQILRAHARAIVVSSTRDPIQIGGTTSTSDQVVFEYEQVFAGTRQTVASELLLSNEQGKCLKVRTTAPSAQRAAALDGTRILLKGLNPKR